MDHSGLRFDIYERVHLPDELVGIRELEEIELVPHIQLFSETDHVVLRGNLWLTGKYAGTDGVSGRLMEHFIPVEITLPMNRVVRIDDVAVEIENFDIELISSRTLNVTGVLSLSGLADPQPAGNVPLDGDEEVLFVHQTEQPDEAEADALRSPESQAQTIAANEAAVRPETPAERSEPAEAARGSAEAFGDATDVRDSANAADVGDSAASSGSQEEQWAAPLVADGEDRTSAKSARNADTVRLNDAEAAAEQAGESQEDAAEISDSLFAAEEAEAAAPAASFDDSADDGAREQSNETNAKQELTIAISGKSADPDGDLRSLKAIAEQGEFRAAAIAEADEQEPEEEQTDRSNAVEWKKLFLSEEGAEPKFKQVRICIVQKEETLEQIAERYRLNPREIALYNRLGSQEVDEGQVLYIPGQT